MSCAAMPKGFLNEPYPIKRGTMRLNLIVTSANPQTCARNLDAVSLNEQIVAVSILLSRYAKDCTYEYNTLWRLLDAENSYMRWLWNDETNVDWLKEYGILLHCEYSQRYDRKHEGARDIFNFIDDFRPPIGLDPKGFLNWACDDKIDFHTDPDVHRAYRNYMCAKWNASVRKPTWGCRLPPAWYIEYQVAFECPDNRIKLLGESTDGKKLVSFTVAEGPKGRGRVSYTEGVSA